MKLGSIMKQKNYNNMGNWAKYPEKPTTPNYSLNFDNEPHTD